MRLAALGDILEEPTLQQQKFRELGRDIAKLEREKEKGVVEVGVGKTIQYRCDGCQLYPIKDVRFSIEGVDLDLCLSCYNSGISNNVGRGEDEMAIVGGARVEVGSLRRMEAFKVVEGNIKAEEVSGEWACGVCSLINVASATNCSVCTSARGAIGVAMETGGEEEGSGKKRKLEEEEREVKTEDTEGAKEPVYELSPYAELNEHVLENMLNTLKENVMEGGRVEECRSQIELLVKLSNTDDQKFTIKVVEKLIECLFLRGEKVRQGGRSEPRSEATSDSLVNPLAARRKMKRYIIVASLLAAHLRFSPHSHTKRQSK